MLDFTISDIIAGSHLFIFESIRLRYITSVLLVVVRGGELVVKISQALLI